VRGENRSTRGKTSHSRVENQQSQSTYDAECRNSNLGHIGGRQVLSSLGQPCHLECWSWTWGCSGVNVSIKPNLLLKIIRHEIPHQLTFHVFLNNLAFTSQEICHFNMIHVQINFLIFYFHSCYVFGLCINWISNINHTTLNSSFSISNETVY